ncbi:MAG: cytidylate kinase-like family protein [Bacteroidales bacterium]|nr:cytidylate kinase-like family protein [Bacteroidales bacterium]
MNLNEPFVLNVSREVGSGGHTVGKILAEKLNVRYCDKQLLEALRKQFNLTQSGIEKLKGEKKTWLSGILGWMAPIPSARNLGVDFRYCQEFRPDVTSDDIFEAEKEILRGFAEMGSCVIAGRSGFFVLKDHPNKLNVFITASMPFRIERIMRKQGIPENEAAIIIESLDKSRENYIKRFAHVSRYDARNYDLVLRSDGHSEEELAGIILSYIG